MRQHEEPLQDPRVAVQVRVEMGEPCEERSGQNPGDRAQPEIPSRPTKRDEGAHRHEDRFGERKRRKEHSQAIGRSPGRRGRHG